MWIELADGDARRAGIAEGDLVEIRTPRGRVTAAARITGIRAGVVFLPFQYGYWDTESTGDHRAANELTLTDWDPVSKQPIFKTVAAAVRRVATRRGPAPTTAASALHDGLRRPPEVRRPTSTRSAF